MKLSAPKNVTFYIALTLGVLGLLGFFVQLPFITGAAFCLISINLGFTYPKNPRHFQPQWRSGQD